MYCWIIIPPVSPSALGDTASLRNPILHHIKSLDFQNYNTNMTMPKKAPNPSETKPATSTCALPALLGASLPTVPVFPAAVAVHDTLPHPNPLRQHPPPKLASQLFKPLGQMPLLYELAADATPVISAVVTYVEPPVLVPTGTRIVTPLDTSVDEEAAAGQSVVEQSLPIRQQPGR